MSGTQDVLAKELRAEFRGVEFFPVTFSFSFDQQHIVHSYADRDAARIESTGRNPATHSFQAIFQNGNLIASEEQYPLAWRKMVAAFLDRSTGILLHPSLGPLKVKARAQSTQWDGTRRDGVTMSLDFVEASDEEDELSRRVSASASYSVEYEAGQLDGANPTAKVKNPDPLLEPSLLDSIKKLTGAISMAQASLGNVAALVESYANAIGDLTDKLEELNEPSDAGVIEALKRLYSSVLDLVPATRAKGRPVTMVSVVRDAQTSAVAAAFSNKLEDLLSLNPALGSKTSVAAGTQIFVYAA